MNEMNTSGGHSTDWSTPWQLSFNLSQIVEQNVINGIICIESTQTETFQCGYTEIIDIQSVTIAYVENTNQCTEEYMIPVIETILPPCKRSAKDSENTDGPEVYKRYCFIFIKLAHVLLESIVLLLV